MDEQPKHRKRGIVERDYSAQYHDPIVMRRGDEVALGEQDNEYPGWVWCTHSDGRSGWVPESLLSIEGDIGRALHDYTAKELTALRGELLELGEERSGWVWATNPQSQSGWLPVDHVAAADDLSTSHQHPLE